MSHSGSALNPKSGDGAGQGALDGLGFQVRRDGIVRYDDETFIVEVVNAGGDVHAHAVTLTPVAVGTRPHSRPASSAADAVALQFVMWESMLRICGPSIARLGKGCSIDVTFRVTTREIAVG